MSKTITPEILHGLFVGTLKGICAWGIPQQLKEKLERQIKELEETQVGNPLLVNLEALPQSDFSVQDWIDSMKNTKSVHLPYPTNWEEVHILRPARTYYNSDGTQGEDIFDTTSMD